VVGEHGVQLRVERFQAARAQGGVQSLDHAPQRLLGVRGVEVVSGRIQLLEFAQLAFQPGVPKQRGRLFGLPHQDPHMVAEDPAVPGLDAAADDRVQLLVEAGAELAADQGRRVGVLPLADAIHDLGAAEQLLEVAQDPLHQVAGRAAAARGLVGLRDRVDTQLGQGAGAPALEVAVVGAGQRQGLCAERVVAAAA